MTDFSTIKLDTQLTVGGEDIVLVLDQIGGKKERVQLIAQECDQHHQLVVSESHIVKARQEYKKIPVYGIWSVLILNNLIGSEKVQVLPLDKGEGLYAITSDNKIIETGYYTAGFIPGHPDTDIDSSHHIVVDLNNIKLPQKALLTRGEVFKIENERKAADKRRRVYLFIGIAATGLIASAVLPFFQSESSVDQTEKHLVNQLRNEYQDLVRTRGMAIPDSSILAHLVLMANSDNQIEVVKEIDFLANEIEVIFSSKKFVPNKYQYTELSDGRAKVLWIAQ